MNGKKAKLLRQLAKLAAPLEWKIAYKLFKKRYKKEGEV